MPRIFKYDEIQSFEIDMERKCYICKVPTAGFEVVEFLDRDYNIEKIAHFVCEYPRSEKP